MISRHNTRKTVNVDSVATLMAALATLASTGGEIILDPAGTYNDVLFTNISPAREIVIRGVSNASRADLTVTTPGAATYGGGLKNANNLTFQWLNIGGANVNNGYCVSLVTGGSKKTSENIAFVECGIFGEPLQRWGDYSNGGPSGTKAVLPIAFGSSDSSLTLGGYFILYRCEIHDVLFGYRMPINHRCKLLMFDNIFYNHYEDMMFVKNPRQYRAGSFSRAGNVTTCTTTADSSGSVVRDHNLQNGDKVTVVCTTDPTFSASEVTVSNVTANTFKYDNPGADATITNVANAGVEALSDCGYVHVMFNQGYYPIGKAQDSNAGHVDFLQLSGLTGTYQNMCDYINLVVEGNILWVGNTRGVAQGIFCDDMSPGGRFRGARICGNIICVARDSYTGHALTLDTSNAVEIRDNILVVADPTSAELEYGAPDKYKIIAATWSAGVATYTTKADHDLVSGQTYRVIGLQHVSAAAVNYNVEGVITVTAANKFTLPIATSPAAVSSYSSGQVKCHVTATSWLAGALTVTTFRKHGAVAGQMVELNGIDPYAYNGRYMVTSVIDEFNFTVTVPDGGAYVSGGAVYTQVAATQKPPYIIALLAGKVEPVVCEYNVIPSAAGAIIGGYNQAPTVDLATYQAVFGWGATPTIASVADVIAAFAPVAAQHANGYIDYVNKKLNSAKDINFLGVADINNVALSQEVVSHWMRVLTDDESPFDVTIAGGTYSLADDLDGANATAYVATSTANVPSNKFIRAKVVASSLEAETVPASVSITKAGVTRVNAMSVTTAPTTFFPSIANGGTEKSSSSATGASGTLLKAFIAIRVSGSVAAAADVLAGTSAGNNKLFQFAGANLVRAQFGSSATVRGDWVTSIATKKTFLISVDMTKASAEEGIFLYTDVDGGLPLSVSAWTQNPTLNQNIFSTLQAFSGLPNITGFEFAWADFGDANYVLPDIHDQAVRNKFCKKHLGNDGAGATGTAPKIFLHGTATEWNDGFTNKSAAAGGLNFTMVKQTAGSYT